MKKLFVMLTLVMTLVMAAAALSEGAGELTWSLSNGTLTISCSGNMPDYPYSSAPWYSKRASIKQVILNGGITSVGNEAFEDCTALTSVTLPDGISSIGNFAFYNCSSLASVSLPGSAVSIGSYAFSCCSSLKNVSISSGVTSIGERAFESCSSLASIALSDSISSVGDYAFDGCNAKRYCSINSSTAKALGNAGYSFCVSECKSLSLSWAEDILSVTGCDSDAVSASIPEGVSAIADKAFYSCSALQTLSLPSSLVSVGSYAFCYCKKLSAVHITDLDSWAQISFKTYYSNPLCYSGALYLDGEPVTEAVLSDAVTKIGNYAFYSCSSLTSIRIPKSVSSIGSYAFKNCGSLTAVTLPDSVTRICSSAFYGCTGITNVRYSGTEDQWNSITIDSGNDCLTNCTLTHILLLTGTLGSNAKYTLEGIAGSGDYSLTLSGSGAIDDEDAESLPFAEYRSGITSMTMPGGITSIGTYAFSGFTGLASLTVPASVASIDDTAFSGDDSLTLTVTCASTAQTFARTKGMNCTVIDHTGITKDDAVDATCENSGVTEGSHCEACGDILTAQETIPAKGHSEAADAGIPARCLTAGLTAGSHCSRCGKVFTAQEVIPATHRHHPRSDGKCKTCGKTFSLKGLKVLTLPSSLKALSAGSFCGIPAEAIVIPDKITTVPAGVFTGCEKLKYVWIAHGTAIEDGAFKRESTESIEFVVRPQ